MTKTCQAISCNNIIWGHGFCKVHQWMRTDRAELTRERYQLKKSRLKPRSQRWLESGPQKAEEAIKMWKLFSGLWNNLKEKKCWSCGESIYGENSSAYWHHLLPKSKHPELKFERENLYFCCLDCHSKTEAGFPPNKIKIATEEAKEKFLK